MENRAQFDLDRSLSQWRQRLLAREPIQAGETEELESHLLDSLAHWQEKGLSEEEAFAIATRRLGDANALSNPRLTTEERGGFRGGAQRFCSLLHASPCNPPRDSG